jgi:hypothetical protein
LHKRKIELTWQGPFSWPKYGTEPSDVIPDICGVYLFTFKYRNGYLVYAAGITKSMKTRFSQHTREYKQGHYNVLDVEYAQLGKRKEIWHGWQYAKTHQEEFIERKEIILQAVDNQLSAFKIFVTEVPDLRIRERIECAIMQNIYTSSEPWAALADRGMCLRGKYHSELGITLLSKCQEPIYGLPNALEI